MKKLYLKSIFALVLISVMSISVSAQTVISGSIYSNSTWTKSNSPYVVTDNVVVFEGAVLTIEPGVTINFYKDKGIDLRGKLVASGTHSDPIIFTHDGAQTSTQWSGIKLNNWNNLEVILKYTKVTQADVFLNCEQATGNISIKNSIFENNNKVIYGYNGVLIDIDHSSFNNNVFGIDAHRGTKIHNSEFKNNEYGLYEVYHIEVQNCVFENNNKAGISCTNTWAGKIDKSIFKYNNIGLEFRMPQGNNAPQITNNNITCNNIGFKIAFCSGTDAEVIGNTFSNNVHYDVYNNSQNSCYLGQNCWGTTDNKLINDKIYDGHDNLNHGLVNYAPPDSNCVVNICSFPTGGIGKLKLAENSSLEIFPNPFRDYTNVKFEIYNNAHATLKIYSIDGKLIKTIVDRELSKGEYQFKIDRSKLENGIYFLILENDLMISRKKLVVQ